ncbi:MAG: hypothetical protein R3C05_03930 [Pirellulaceae bacterium]
MVLARLPRSDTIASQQNASPPSTNHASGESLRCLIVLLTASLLGLAGFASAGIAKELHVAKFGSDQNAGSEATPLGSIQRLLELSKQPGDRIIVHAGVYAPRRPLVFRFPGRDDAPIQLMAAANEVAVIDGSNMQPDTDLILIATHHVHVRGLVIRNATRNGIAICGVGVEFTTSKSPAIRFAIVISAESMPAAPRSMIPCGIFCWLATMWLTCHSEIDANERTVGLSEWGRAGEEPDHPRQPGASCRW